MVVHLVLMRPAVLPSAEQALELLLLRRANTGFMDGYFSLPGGHVEQAELPLAAVVRELEEEVGVLVEDPLPLTVMPYQSGQHRGYNFVFWASRWQGVAHIAEPQASDLMCWVPPAVLPQPCAPWVPSVAVQAEQAYNARKAGSVETNWYQELGY